MVWVVLILVISLAAAVTQTLTGQVGAWLGWWPTPFWPKDLVTSWVGLIVGYGVLGAWLWWTRRWL